MEVGVPVEISTTSTMSPLLTGTLFYTSRGLLRPPGKGNYLLQSGFGAWLPSPSLPPPQVLSPRQPSLTVGPPPAPSLAPVAVQCSRFRRVIRPTTWNLDCLLHFTCVLGNVAIVCLFCTVCMPILGVRGGLCGGHWGRGYPHTRLGTWGSESGEVKLTGGAVLGGVMLVAVMLKF